MTSGDYSLVQGEVRPRGDDARRSVRYTDGSLSVSPTVAQIVDRARTRFGLSLEVLNAGLQPVAPEAGGDFARAIEASAPARSAVSEALLAGRNRTFDLSDTTYMIQPLRGGRGSRKPVGLLAVRQVSQAAGDAERWLEFLRIAIEAELASSDGLREERLQARRTLAALRFLGQLGSLRSDEELSAAVVQAAAVWFDVDARLYRRGLDGILHLHAHLPGIPDAGRFPSLPDVPGGRPAVRRIAAGVEVEGLGWAVPEALVIPIPVEGGADRVLAIGGVLPAEAQVIFETVADAAGSHLARLAAVERAAARERFEGIAGQASRDPELAVIDLLRQVMAETNAASGLVTLFDAGGSRRIAALGAPMPVSVDDEGVSAARLTLPVALCGAERALLDLAPAETASFSLESAAIVREALPALQMILIGVIRRGEPVQAAVLPEGDGTFVDRITQELERAKRFDLGLSMLLIDIDPQRLDARRLRDLMSSVRAQLRGSDVLGVVGQGRIAALLVHTDVDGVSAVVSRIQQTLRRQSGSLPPLRMGRAVLTRECATTTAFLTEAARSGVPVVAA